ncbi:MAG: hypothetical protein KIS97_13490 [Nitrospira sp.]|nr:hypothetical protein [Nitrospira sp.]
MPSITATVVNALKLDLNNFRTVRQVNEIKAIHSMISISPAWFWALTESLLDDGYHLTENIIVLKSGSNGQDLIVKEGNRRVGALKLILGLIKCDQIQLPSHLEKKVADLPAEWKRANSEVPCAVYEAEEFAKVDRIVTLTHATAELAGRDEWNSVARARYSRDKNGKNEPALDLLEKFLVHGRNLTSEQAERWAGEYPLTVLDEMIKKLASRLGVASSRQLADSYPSTVNYRKGLEDILRDIGVEIITFKRIRDTQEDIAHVHYGIPPVPIVGQSAPNSSPSNSSGSVNSGGGNIFNAPKPPLGNALYNVGSASPQSQSTVSPPVTGTATLKPKAVSVVDPKAVMRALKQFQPRGNNRNKVVTLRDEMLKLKLDKHPHAFCFLLRSMFEISAKAFCDDYASKGGPSYTQKGNERKLADILTDICDYLVGTPANQQLKKTLHGARVDLGTHTSILSVTSMNQLIHNPHFSITEHSICVSFGNIFPLLQEMNR